MGDCRQAERKAGQVSLLEGSAALALDQGFNPMVLPAGFGADRLLRHTDGP